MKDKKNRTINDEFIINIFTQDKWKDIFAVDNYKKNLYKRYKNECATNSSYDDPRMADGVPIYARKKIRSSDVNRKMHYNSFKQISRQKADYLSKNIVVNFDETFYKDEDLKKLKKIYDRINYKNSLTSIELSLMTYCGGWGDGFMLLNQDKKDIEIKIYKPWECEIFKDYGVIYKRIKTDTNTTIVTNYFVYTKDKIYEVLLHNEKYKIISKTKHTFGDIPIIHFINNEEVEGNAEWSICQQDAYDELKSDWTNENIQTRLSYLLATGVGDISSNFANMLKSSNTLVLDENAKMEYVEKNVNVESFEKNLKNVWSDMWSASCCYDPTQLSQMKDAREIQIENFYRQVEDDGNRTELFWKKSYKKMDDMILNFFKINKLGSEGISRTFHRSMSIDDMGKLEAFTRSGGILSNQTKIEIAYPLLNPQEEEERINREEEERIGGEIDEDIENNNNEEENETTEQES